MVAGMPPRPSGHRSSNRSSRRSNSLNNNFSIGSASTNQVKEKRQVLSSSTATRSAQVESKDDSTNKKHLHLVIPADMMTKQDSTGRDPPPLHHSFDDDNEDDCDGDECSMARSGYTLDRFADLVTNEDCDIDNNPISSRNVTDEGDARKRDVKNSETAGKRVETTGHYEGQNRNTYDDCDPRGELTGITNVDDDHHYMYSNTQVKQPPAPSTGTTMPPLIHNHARKTETLFFSGSESTTSDVLYTDFSDQLNAAMRQPQQHGNAIHIDEDSDILQGEMISPLFSFSESNEKGQCVETIYEIDDPGEVHQEFMHLWNANDEITIEEEPEQADFAPPGDTYDKELETPHNNHLSRAKQVNTTHIAPQVDSVESQLYPPKSPAHQISSYMAQKNKREKQVSQEELLIPFGTLEHKNVERHSKDNYELGEENLEMKSSSKESESILQDLLDSEVKHHHTPLNIAASAPKVPSDEEEGGRPSTVTFDDCSERDYGIIKEKEDGFSSNKHSSQLNDDALLSYLMTKKRQNDHYEVPERDQSPTRRTENISDPVQIAANDPRHAYRISHSLGDEISEFTDMTSLGWPTKNMERLNSVGFRDMNETVNNRIQHSSHYDDDASDVKVHIGRNDRYDTSERGTHDVNPLLGTTLYLKQSRVSRSKHQQNGHCNKRALYSKVERDTKQRGKTDSVGKLSFWPFARWKKASSKMGGKQIHLYDSGVLNTHKRWQESLDCTYDVTKQSDVMYDEESDEQIRNKRGSYLFESDWEDKYSANFGVPSSNEIMAIVEEDDEEESHHDNMHDRCSSVEFSVMKNIQGQTPMEERSLLRSEWERGRIEEEYLKQQEAAILEAINLGNDEALKSILNLAAAARQQAGEEGAYEAYHHSSKASNTSLQILDGSVYNHSLVPEKVIGTENRLRVPKSSQKLEDTLREAFPDNDARTADCGQDLPPVHSSKKYEHW